jgi:hypothetical protein
VSTPISTEYFLKLGQSLQDAGLETAAPKTRAKLKK